MEPVRLKISDSSAFAGMLWHEEKDHAWQTDGVDASDISRQLISFLDILSILRLGLSSVPENVAFHISFIQRRYWDYWMI